MSDTNEAPLLHGIDISWWQPPIAWAEVPTEIKFAYVRASHGASQDDRFVKHITGARNLGLRVGAYHYLEAKAPVQAQVDTFLRTAGRFLPGHDMAALPNVLVPALDVEEGGTDAPARALKFLRAVEARTGDDGGNNGSGGSNGIRMLVYTNAGFADRTRFVDYTELATYDLWVAHWNVKVPVLPEPWRSCGKTWNIWQHTNKGKVSGVSGGSSVDVDLNVARILR